MVCGFQTELEAMAAAAARQDPVAPASPVLLATGGPEEQRSTLKLQPNYKIINEENHLKYR